MIIKQGLRSTKKNDIKVFAELEKVSNFTWAYIAGWIDGDGFISTLEDKKGHADRRIGIKLIDREIVEWFADLFYTSLRKVPKDKREDGYNRKTMYVTTVSGLRAHYICEKIHPYLIEKTNQANKFLTSFGAYTIPTYMKHTDEEFMAWFTGYSEAEGAFMFKTCERNRVNAKGEKYKYKGPAEVNFEIVNTNESIMQYIQHRLTVMGFKMGKLNRRKKSFGFIGKKNTRDRRLIKRKNLFRLFLSGTSAQILYQDMLPLMQVERKIAKVKLSLAHVFREKRSSIPLTVKQQKKYTDFLQKNT
tara:strand:+ start:60 stop:968 length:909 start_codon:yes stop_codon:yes gene_type:complete